MPNRIDGEPSANSGVPATAAWPMADAAVRQPGLVFEFVFVLLQLSLLLVVVEVFELV